MKRQKEFQLSAIDNTIVNELNNNGRISYKKLAEKLEVSEGTVRYRTKKMIENGYLKIVGTINPFFFKNSITALIGIRLEARARPAIMKKLSQLSGVQSVCLLTGRYNLMIEVFLNLEEI